MNVNKVMLPTIFFFLLALGNFFPAYALACCQGDSDCYIEIQDIEAIIAIEGDQLYLDTEMVEVTPTGMYLLASSSVSIPISNLFSNEKGLYTKIAGVNSRGVMQIWCPVCKILHDPPACAF